MNASRARGSAPRPEHHLLGRESDAEEREAEKAGGKVLRSGELAAAISVADVRIHHDDAAVRSVGAAAYTLGSDIVLGDAAVGQIAAHGVEGSRTLAHQLGHVLSERGGRGPAVVRRRIVPEDVSIEMVGQSMRLADDAATPAGLVPAGTVGSVVNWVNASPTARIRFAARLPRPETEAEVAKTILRPVRPSMAGIAPYSAGVDPQASSVVRGAAKLAAERVRSKGPRPGEIPRLEGLQTTRLTQLNKVLIQETMFNRFDPTIKKWTDHYNTSFGYVGKRALNPNLVKSMLFQESQLGTSGEHLIEPPPSPVSRKSRFNVGQVIDTSGPALLIMISEIEPALIAKHNLTNLQHDLFVAQAREAKLKATAPRTAAEDAELADLKAHSGEAFYWTYRAPGAASGLEHAVVELFTPAAGTTSRQLDYDFWIRSAVRWLFEKRKGVGSWEEAVRAYNGSGADAVRYRKEVVERSAAAVTGKASGKPFVPEKI